MGTLSLRMHVVVSTWRGLKITKESRYRCTLPASAAPICTGPVPALLALKRGKKGVKYEATINEDTQSLSNMVATQGMLKWEQAPAGEHVKEQHQALCG